MNKENIHFFKEGVSFRIMNGDKIKSWISKIFSHEGFSVDCLNYIFCSDKHLRRINKKYLGHDYYTDIITFDNSTLKKKIEGDVFISIDRVKINARLYRVTFADELHRVMIHGALHLTGYEDKSAQSKKIMREKENDCLMLRSF